METIFVRSIRIQLKHTRMCDNCHKTRVPGINVTAVIPTSLNCIGMTDKAIYHNAVWILCDSACEADFSTNGNMPENYRYGK